MNLRPLGYEPNELPTAPPRDESWWMGLDSNQRSETRQIYSLLPLTTREPIHRQHRYYITARYFCQAKTKKLFKLLTQRLKHNYTGSHSHVQRFRTSLHRDKDALVCCRQQSRTHAVGLIAHNKSQASL